MKMKERLLLPFCCFSVGFLFAFMLLPIVEFLLFDALYATAAHRISFLPYPNPVTDEKGYEVFLSVSRTVTAFFTLFILHGLALRADGYRYKRTVVDTGGMFPLTEGIGRYLKEFGLFDLAVAASLPLALAPAAAVIPKSLIGDLFLKFPLRLPSYLLETMSAEGAVILLVLCSLLARFLASILAVRRWRALWLCDLGTA